MRKVLGGVIIGIGISFFVMNGFADESTKGGEAAFNEHCAVCHPSGGNLFNPKKTLYKKDLLANSIRTPADIIKIMRNPGPGMTKFDEETVPDKEAKEIAEYMLKAFQ